MSAAPTSASYVINIGTRADTFSSVCIRGELARRVMNDNVKARCALRNEPLAQLCRTCAAENVSRLGVFKASPRANGNGGGGGGGGGDFSRGYAHPRARRAKRIRESIMRHAAPPRLERVTIFYTDARARVA